MPKTTLDYDTEIKAAKKRKLKLEQEKARLEKIIKNIKNMDQGVFKKTRKSAESCDQKYSNAIIAQIGVVTAKISSNHGSNVDTNVENALNKCEEELTRVKGDLTRENETIRKLAQQRQPWR